MGPVAPCLGQNAKEESGDRGPDFSTPEVAILKPIKSRALEFDTVFFRGLSMALPNREKKAMVVPLVL